MIEFFYHVVALSISLTPIIVALLILMPLFRIRYSANWRYWMWLAISLRLLIPFSFGEFLPLQFNCPLYNLGNIEFSESLHQSSMLQITISPKSTAASTFFTNLTFWNMLMIIYFTGAIAFLVYKFVLYIIFCRSIRRWSRDSSDSRIAEMVSELSKIYKFNVGKTRLQIRIWKKISGPMVVGLFRHTLLLPDNNYDNKKLKMILSHEIIHLKRHDLWYKLGLLFVRCIGLILLYI